MKALNEIPSAMSKGKEKFIYSVLKQDLRDRGEAIDTTGDINKVG